jgi:hypothetical protein
VRRVGPTRRAAVVLVLAGAAAARAQPPATPDAARAAEVEALEPAVDVGAAPRPDPRPVSRAAPAEPRAMPAPAADAADGPGPSSAGSAGSAQHVTDRLDLGTTSITGNQELPKVLYIVPWKRSDLGELVGRPANTLLDEVLAPVDPDVFERHLDYYDELFDAPRSGEAGVGD